MTDPLYNPGPNPEYPDGCAKREIDEAFGKDPEEYDWDYDEKYAGEEKEK